MEIKNAQIDYVKLYIEDHDILTFSIGLKMCGGGCALGGYALDQAFRINELEDDWKYERLSSPAGLDCIRKIMEVVGVRSWEDLEGKYIRYEDNGWCSPVTKIGNIIKDDWIDVADFMKNYNYNHWIEQFAKTKEFNSDYSKGIEDFISWAYKYGIDFSFMGKIKADGNSNIPDKLDEIKERFYNENI